MPPSDFALLVESAHHMTPHFHFYLTLALWGICLELELSVELEPEAAHEHVQRDEHHENSVRESGYCYDQGALKQQTRLALLTVRFVVVWHHLLEGVHRRESYERDFEHDKCP